MGASNMALRSTRSRARSLVLLGVVAASALVAVAPAAAAAAHHPGHHRTPHFRRFGGQVFIFSGTLATAPGATPTTLQVTVSGGNGPALHALVGNTTQPLTFAVDANTSYVDWTASSRGNAPSSTTPGTLVAGDPVHLRIRARWGTPLATLLTTPTRMVDDFAATQKVSGRMFVFEGSAVAVDPTAQTITLTVQHGNWFALNAMLGKPVTETFHYDASTQFLSWDHRSPHTFLPAQIQAGDPITLRTRATFGTPLASLLAAPLWKVNDHEPASSIDSSGGNVAIGQ
jgi:hypothetical protein